MKAVALICLISIALNSALAGMGIIVLCKHDEGETHRISNTTHEEASHGACCHHDFGTASDGLARDHECNSCTDTEIELDDLETARLKAGSERSANPSNFALVPIDSSVISVADPLVLNGLHASDAPSTVASLTALQIRKIVLRV